MSLQVWLPLNGDLNNQGLSNVSTVGGTIDNSGKIGKCYLVNKTTPITINHTIPKTSEWTMTWWMKLPSSMNNATAWEQMFAFDVINSDAGTNSVQYIDWASYHNVKIYDDSNHQWKWAAPGTDFEYDKWHHWALCHTANGVGVQCKMYIDGVLIDTYNNTTHQLKIIPGSIKIGNGISTGGFYINDFRIYDHCLSAKEVKELSKGLVLHYKLDGKYETTTNLASSSVGGWNNSGNCTRLTNDTSLNSSKPTQDNVASVKITTTGNCALICGTTSASLPSKTLTFSIWCYLSGPQENNTIYIRSTKTDGNVGNFEYKGSTNPATWPLNQWLYLTKTITTASDATTFYFCTYANTLDRYIALNGWQIEEKDHASSYIEPGESRNCTTEFDCSGYNNNGIRNNNPQFVQNTIRYKNSTSLNGTNQTIEIGNLSTIVPSGVFTFNIWFYKTELSGKSYDTIFGGPSGFEVETRNAAETNPVVVPWNWGKSSIAYEFNKWNMLTMIKTSSETQWYLNGELWATGSVGTIPSGNYFLGSWRDTNSQNYKGLLSDARIYATALSADDVLELYQTSASIGKNGNIYAYELEEV